MEKSKKTFRDVKNNNLALILQTILRKGHMSRIEIAESCGLSPSTVSANISLLLETGLVEEYSVGTSTGGRPPIAIRVRPDCCSVISFEITRSGVTAKVFNALSELICENVISSRMLSGNALKNKIVSFVENVREGSLHLPQKLLGIGLLCQDDFSDHDLRVEYSTSLSSDVVPLESYLTSYFKVPVRKEYMERYSVEYYMQNAENANRNYAYINLGQEATASFFVDKKAVEIAGKTIFQVGVFPWNGREEAANGEVDARRQKERGKRTGKTEETVEMLAAFIASACVFFPVKDVFLGGVQDNLDEIAYKTSEQLQFHPPVRRISLGKLQLSQILSRRMMVENHRLLIA